uniref:Uncharacterized protein n=1 Tax=Grammatophora oceanica TaxID=210454 RepID=A0A7S1UYY8_9STRA|mmetsp:Transcript_30350/g.44894  ORF Transcript_30350/g.44894 Transcript_30350/m.44894 type:complete len:308 (+) Transcript_30350:116-1039(+)|eukprot:CAMPEP_0194029322 /NCGR_PEP_ID=MMETSP0009_2-20130614/3076_1 /TAXON_ID=210454 /ORGANISM="Grammatophora oceanica, Strain CCMP 410" /LENGTH=307 /DNA_ID=CAMNT_0038668951 /DNA_START=66 /DNA_END=989 /DNA_ORIENTATION=-
MVLVTSNTDSDVYVVFSTHAKEETAETAHDDAILQESTKRYHTIIQSYSSTYHLLPGQEDKDLIIGTIFDQLKKEGAVFVRKSDNNNDDDSESRIGRTVLRDETSCQNHIKRAISELKPVGGCGQAENELEVLEKPKKRRRRSSATKPQQQQGKRSKRSLPSPPPGVVGPTLLDMLYIQAEQNPSTDTSPAVVPFVPAHHVSFDGGFMRSSVAVALDEYCRDMLTDIKADAVGDDSWLSTSGSSDENKCPEESAAAADGDYGGEGGQHICDTVLDCLDNVFEVDIGARESDSEDSECCWDPLPLEKR